MHTRSLATAYEILRWCTTYDKTVVEIFDKLVADDVNVGALLPFPLTLLPPPWLLFVMMLTLPLTLLPLLLLLLLLLSLLPGPVVLFALLVCSAQPLAFPPPLEDADNEEVSFVLAEFEPDDEELLAVFDGELEGGKNGLLI
jgi:hypothetical protein